MTGSSTATGGSSTPLSSGSRSTGLAGLAVVGRRRRRVVDVALVDDRAVVADDEDVRHRSCRSRSAPRVDRPHQVAVDLVDPDEVDARAHLEHLIGSTLSGGRRGSARVRQSKRTIEVGPRRTTAAASPAMASRSLPSMSRSGIVDPLVDAVLRHAPQVVVGADPATVRRRAGTAASRIRSGRCRPSSACHAPSPSRARRLAGSTTNGSLPTSDRTAPTPRGRDRSRSTTSRSGDAASTRRSSRSTPSGAIDVSCVGVRHRA